jgi:hypothetical protein
MGNRFREKTVEEGLAGDVAREALKEAVTRSGKEGKGTSGNRRRHHEPKPEPKNVGAKGIEEESLLRSVDNASEMGANERTRTNVGEEADVEEPRQEDSYAADEVEVQPRILSNGRGGRVAKGMAKVLGGDILADKWVLGQIRLLLLCMAFLLLIVANRYQVESLSRKKMKVMERVNELREQQILLQKKNQNAVRISQIRDDLESEKGLGIMPTPPNVI